MNVAQVRQEAAEYFERVFEQSQARLAYMRLPMEIQKEGKYLSLSGKARLASGECWVRDTEAIAWTSSLIVQASSKLIGRLTRDEQLTDSECREIVAAVCEAASACQRRILAVVHARHREMLKNA